MTSVVLVQVTPDLKYCKAYISVLADEEQAKDTIRGLKSAEGFIRTQLAKAVNLRNTPEISFYPGPVHRIRSPHVEAHRRCDKGSDGPG